MTAAVRTIRLPAGETWRPLNSMSEEIPPKPKPPRRRRRPSNKVDAPRPLSNRMDNPLVQLGRLQKHAAAITRLIRELPASELAIHGTRALTVRSQGWIWCGHGAINFRLYSGSIRRDRASGRLRRIRVVLTIAHLNQTAGDDRDENMAALCQFCHLYHDRFQHAASARSNRSARKDRARPLLALLESG